MTMERSQVLIETPSGFALFSVSDDVLKKPDDVWIHFRDVGAARFSTHTLGYVRIEDKSSAWEGKTFASKKLIALVKKFCKEGSELYVNMKLQLDINELRVKCSSNYTLVGELIWGLKNVVHELVPQEKGNITKEYCLPLSNGLQKFLNEYCINLPPLFINKDFISKVGFLAFLDITREEVSQKLRGYDEFIENIGQRIHNDLSYAKVLANVLVPELLPEPGRKYDFSEMFPKELVSKIEEVRSSSTPYHEKRLTMNNRKELIGGLANLIVIPLHMDKLITYVKAMESELLQKIQLELELEEESK
ncbi:hypothetical protein QOZ80_8AG0639020 [Eleusine coracana subsp. coracana]|nr:hypothetical protein QOZ80_8AG0639020 [Eleusine coracana subsp. coracana]